MRALIADDEAPARAKLRRALAASDDVEVVGEATSGREAVAMIKRLSPDIVFLDIRMPGLDGFGVVDAIATDDAPYVVFVTANEEHALRAFEVGAVDYLLKPYTVERFGHVLQRARGRLASRDRTPKHAESAAHEFLQRLLVTVDGHALFLATAVVDRVVAEGNATFGCSAEAPSTGYGRPSVCSSRAPRPRAFSENQSLDAHPPRCRQGHARVVARRLSRGDARPNGTRLESPVPGGRKTAVRIEALTRLSRCVRPARP